MGGDRRSLYWHGRVRNGVVKAAGDADRRMEEMYRQEGWGKE